MAEGARGYVLGADPAELERLNVQAAYYRPATEDALRRGGLGPGMRVLDLGCGNGGVTFVAAEIVGPDGSVHGVDAASEPLAQATSAAARRRLATVTFEQADLLTYEPAQSVDALIGRLVLMYLPEPAAVVRRLAEKVTPGGLVLFQDFAMTSARQRPETEVFRVTLARVLQAFTAAGFPTEMGYGLGRVLRAAGLSQPQMSVAARWEEEPDAMAYRILAEVTRTLLPVMTRLGVATAAEVDIDTLESRLRRAAAEAGSGVCAPLLVSAWSRRAGAS